MSYGVAAALQAAIFGVLQGDVMVASSTGGAVFDAVPAGQAPELYVAIGPEDVTARDDSAGSVTTHRLIISVVGTTAGFTALKTAAAAVSDALDSAGPSLARGRLLDLSFQKARARKTDGNQARRIDLWFRAIVEDS